MPQDGLKHRICAFRTELATEIFILASNPDFRIIRIKIGLEPLLNDQKDLPKTFVKDVSHCAVWQSHDGVPTTESRRRSPDDGVPTTESRRGIKKKRRTRWSHNASAWITAAIPESPPLPHRSLDVSCRGGEGREREYVGLDYMFLSTELNNSVEDYNSSRVCVVCHVLCPQI